LSCFGGSAWEYDEHTSQYYLHTFARQQPDLNFRNPEVVAAMLDAMRFWLDKGVDGFRVDVITGMIKDEQLRDEPINPNWDGVDPYASLLHIFSSNLPEVHSVIRQMRDLIDSYSDRVLIGEIYALPNSELVKYYGANLDECHLPFNFGLIWIPWTLEKVREKIEEYESALPPGAWPNWVLGNHDQPRIATRAGREQARLATMLLLTLRGTPTYYNGDELGMENVHIPLDMLQDPPAVNQPELADLLGRDPERTPMQWDDSPNAGFAAAGVQPWLPLAENYETVNVEAQLRDERSFMNFFRALLDCRKASPALQVGSYRSLDLTSAEAQRHCLVYERKAETEHMLVALNFSVQEQKVELALSGTGKILISTTMDRRGDIDLAEFTLLPNEGCLILLQ
jgi:alpha-glucosidase